MSDDIAMAIRSLREIAARIEEQKERDSRRLFSVEQCEGLVGEGVEVETRNGEAK